MTVRDESTAEKPFIDKPVQYRLYRHVTDLITSIGQAALNVHKTQVSFKRKKFRGSGCPWNGTRDGHPSVSS